MNTSNNAAPVIAECSVKAPINKVWEALTDNNKMKKWYFVLPDFRAEPGFAFEFVGGESNGE